MIVDSACSKWFSNYESTGSTADVTPCLLLTSRTTASSVVSLTWIALLRLYNSHPHLLRRTSDYLYNQSSRLTPKTDRTYFRPKTCCPHFTSFSKSHKTVKTSEVQDKARKYPWALTIILLLLLLQQIERICQFKYTKISLIASKLLLSISTGLENASQNNPLTENFLSFLQ